MLSTFCCEQEREVVRAGAGHRVRTRARRNTGAHERGRLCACGDRCQVAAPNTILYYKMCKEQFSKDIELSEGTKTRGGQRAGEEE